MAHKKDCSCGYLHHYCYRKQLEAVKQFIDNGMDVNARDCYGQTPLMCTFLVYRSIEKDIRNLRSKLLLLTELLINNGAYTDATNTNNETVLHIIAKATTVLKNEKFLREPIKTIMRAGINTDIKNNKGKRAFEIAFENHAVNSGLLMQMTTFNDDSFSRRSSSVYEPASRWSSMYEISSRRPSIFTDDRSNSSPAITYNPQQNNITPIISRKQNTDASDNPTEQTTTPQTRTAANTQTIDSNNDILLSSTPIKEHILEAKINAIDSNEKKVTNEKRESGQSLEKVLVPAGNIVPVDNTVPASLDTPDSCRVKLQSENTNDDDIISELLDLSIKDTNANSRTCENLQKSDITSKTGSQVQKNNSACKPGLEVNVTVHKEHKESLLPNFYMDIPKCENSALQRCS